MRKKRASNYKSRRWQEQKIAEAHAKRDSDPVKQRKIDEQAIDLLRERVEVFGAEWHVGCTIRLPVAIQEAIDWHGTDFLLLILEQTADI